jgi:hypothetical protein
MLDETRTQQIEQAIAAQEAAGQSWTNQSIYNAVVGNYRESATSGKAGGLKKVEPLKAVDVVNRSKRFGCEPPTGGPAYHRSI